MTGRPCSILFLCTGNSARSILAEALLDKLGAGRFQGHSAGSHPAGRVHPLAADQLRAMGIDPAGLRSKSWDEFARPGAPTIDAVVTVCDAAARKACPVWPGRPATAHWGLPDPAAVAGDIDIRRAAFARTAEALRAAIEALVLLRVDGLDSTELVRHLRTLTPTQQR